MKLNHRYRNRWEGGKKTKNYYLNFLIIVAWILIRFYYFSTPQENPVETKSKDLVNELLVKDAVKNHPCPHCDKRFQTPSGLRFHKESIHGNSRFVCELCGKDFGHKTYLNIHMKAHLPEAVKKLFNCSTCDKCFPTK